MTFFRMLFSLDYPVVDVVNTGYPVPIENKNIKNQFAIQD